MDQEDAIRDQMGETRSSLTDKLETLEKQVGGTVLGATSAVAEKVEAVKESVQETVATLTGTVQDTVTTVKETLHKGVTTFRHFFDVRGHVARHPWPMVAGSIAVGFTAGVLIQRRRRSHHLSHALAAPGSLSEGNGRKASSSGQTLMGSLFAKFGPEITKLKSVALGALFGAVREKVMKAAPEEFSPALHSFFDSMGEKITGERPSAAQSNQPS